MVGVVAARTRRPTSTLLSRDPIRRKLPGAGSNVVSDDVGGVVGTKALEIAMVGSEPAIQDIHDLDRLLTYQQTAGRFLTAMPGVAFDVDPVLSV